MAGRGDVVPHRNRFVSPRHEEIYNRMRDWDFTESRILRQDKLTYSVSNLFLHTSLLFFLTLACPYNGEIIREFYANLVISADRSRFTSRVSFRDIEFSKQDLENFLHIPILGPKVHDIANDPRTNWTAMNLVLRNSNNNRHTASVSGLTQNARVIQHVIRNSLLPKAGDRTNITPLISAATYFCLTQTLFDVGDALIRYFENIVTYTEPRFRRRHNLALGHIISFLIHGKYDQPIPADLDHQPIFYTDASFHILYGKGKGKRPAEAEAEEEEEGGAAHQEAPAQGEPSAPPPPPPGGDDFTSQLGRIEGRLNQFIISSDERWARSEQRWDAWERRYEQDREADRVWLSAKFSELQEGSDDSD